jgi:RNA polymerase sigma-70 factor (ECF subfamily)
MGKNIVGENWREWFNEWGDRFLLFARQQARSLAEAEDIMQEAFVQVWTKRDRLPAIEPGLVFQQIRRTAINRARQDMRRRVREESYAVENEPAFCPDDGSVLSEGLEEALSKLPLDQREVVVLKIWGEQTFESIGNSLEISPNTAASRYRYGLEHLRRLLKGEQS